MANGDWTNIWIEKKSWNQIQLYKYRESSLNSSWDTNNNSIWSGLILHKTQLILFLSGKWVIYRNFTENKNIYDKTIIKTKFFREASKTLIISTRPKKLNFLEKLYYYSKDLKL